MLAEWRKFAGWKVLEFFLQSDMEIHVKGLAKELQISSQTALKYLKLYEKEGLLNRKNIGNLTLYSLKENIFVFELKKTWFLLAAKPFFDSFAKDNLGINSLALYGSHAKGAFDQKSDVDLIVISQQKKLNFNALEKLELKQGKEVKAEVFSVGEWKKISNEKTPFWKEVVKHHLIIFGAEL